MNLEITILAEDVLKNNYYDAHDCPITRALARAGHPELEDCGSIVDNKRNIGFEPHESYDRLLTKLFGMYNFQFGNYHGFRGTKPPSIPVEDFTITLTLIPYESESTSDL